MQRKGFTLIELLVVIVIIGILATISVATFSGYFKKARDSERQAAVRNIATLLKTARATDAIVSYSIVTDNDDGTSTLSTSITGSAETSIDALLLAEGEYEVPALTKTGFTYHYFTNDADNFAVYTCGEDSAALIIDGTQGAKTVVEAANGGSCSANGVTNGTSIVDANHADITGS